jgi:hypothetical protein
VAGSTVHNHNTSWLAAALLLLAGVLTVVWKRYEHAGVRNCICDRRRRLEEAISNSRSYFTLLNEPLAMAVKIAMTSIFSSTSINVAK